MRTSPSEAQSVRNYEYTRLTLGRLLPIIDGLSLGVIVCALAPTMEPTIKTANPKSTGYRICERAESSH